MCPLAADATGVTVRMYVLPGASRTALCGVHGDAVRIRLAAVAEKGAANRALCTYLADRCGVRTSAVSIMHGTTSRHKTVRIEGVTKRSVCRSLGVDIDPGAGAPTIRGGDV